MQQTREIFIPYEVPNWSYRHPIFYSKYSNSLTYHVWAFFKRWQKLPSPFLCIICNLQLLKVAWQALFILNGCLVSMHFPSWLRRTSFLLSRILLRPPVFWYFERMWRISFASPLILFYIMSCLCEMRKTIKVEKLGPHYAATTLLEVGDQKEITVCLKYRTFAYRNGFHCPFVIHTGLTNCSAS